MTNGDGGVEVLKFKMVGIAPGLLMTNGRLSDPLDPWTARMKVLNDIKTTKRTPEDWANIARCEWYASLYVDEDGLLDETEMRVADGARPKIVFPADAIRRSIISGAKFRKQGKQVAPGFFLTVPHFVVKHDGPKDLDEMYEAGKHSKRERIRTRTGTKHITKPYFRQWEIEAELSFVPEMVKRETILQAIVDAGERVGIGNRRPEMYQVFGRWEVQA